MTDEISQSDYQRLVNKYPIFQKIGKQHLGPKIWILYNALSNGETSLDIISDNPCTSLMKNNISLNLINRILTELNNDGILQIKTKTSMRYSLDAQTKYDLQKIVYDMSQNISKIEPILSEILTDCGYPSTYADNDRVYQNITSDDDNIKTSELKRLLSEVAYAGLRLIITLFNRTEKEIAGEI